MRTCTIAFVVVSCAALMVSGQGLGPYYAAVGPGSYHHASTVEEGAARGMADVIRSAGAANLMNSEAAINLEEAERRDIQNRQSSVQAYFDIKRINEEYRSARRRPPPTQQQAIRLSQERLPDRLSAQRVDPLTGGIRWPFGLQLDEFETDRERMEELYAARAEQGYLKPTQYMEVKEVVASMTEELRKHSRALGGNASIEARKFLESLSYEAGFQAG